jgi:hypothetical protein
MPSSIYEFKAIREACDNISKDILGPKEKPEYELVDECETSSADSKTVSPVKCILCMDTGYVNYDRSGKYSPRSLPCTCPTGLKWAKHYQGKLAANPVPVSPPKLSQCPRCGTGLVRTRGRGFCTDCDEYI